MTSTDRPAFDFSFDPMMDPMGVEDGMGTQEDPGPFLPNEEGRTEFLAPDPDRVPVITNAVDRDSSSYAERPAEDRTKELFAQLRAYRFILTGLLEAAREPVSMDALETVATDLRAVKFCVYETPNLVSMLETAGALERVLADGIPFIDYVPEPAIEIIDGEEYYIPTNPPERFFHITEAGEKIISEDTTEERFAKLMEKESNLSSVYRDVLAFATKEHGVSVAEMSAAIDSNPLIAEPRRFFVQHFIDALERLGALGWNGSKWETTPYGEQLLARLSTEGEAPDITIEEGAHFGTAAESDGLRW